MHPETEGNPGVLYLVATPIGNLEDMTIRAITILKTVTTIAAEDTRHTQKLLRHFQIPTPQISYHQHNQASRIPVILEKLHQGEAIALVSDAGMPTISDPGYALVQACIAAAIPVVPIPGACAAICALSPSGLPTDRFIFEGFLPPKGQARLQRLSVLQGEERTIILYESPHRLCQTLSDLKMTLGSERSIVIARELTKIHEQFWRGSLEAAIHHYQSTAPRGEFTLVIAGKPLPKPQWSDKDLLFNLQQLLDQGLSHSEASRQLACQTHLPRRALYQMALTLKK